MEIGRTRGDAYFDAANLVIMTLFLLVVAYPIYFVIIASVSNPFAVNGGDVWLYPVGFSFDGYEAIFRDDSIWLGYRNSVFYTVAGTTVNLLVTLTAGYSLSKKELIGKKPLSLFFLFTMMFNGGLIPTYILIKNLGMINTFWVMIIPNAIGVYNLFITRTFFQTSIPDSLYEAAAMDGCSHSRFFVSVVLPLSTAIVAVQALFYGVNHWNAFFQALIYLSEYKRYPLQLILREILVKNQVTNEISPEDLVSMAERELIAEKLKYGVVIVASVPFLILYPFLQKYFVKGVMLGAIKG